ncbi:MAG TPA: MFS transporter [Candidatus Dormibacteraeota bacterium]|nr:MFS transporter [Candidatus Dormibacteraeota bacterium]
MFNIIILGIASFFTDISSEMVYPLIPFFLTGLGASPAILGTIEGIAESVASLLKVFSGYVSDRLGKRKALTIAGYASSALGKLVLVGATSWTAVLGARVVDRLGKGIRTAPRDALVADSAREGGHGVAFGIHRTLDTFGAVVGVALAYLSFRYVAGNYSAVFMWSLLPATAGVLLLFLVRERSAGPRRAGQPLVARWQALPMRLRLFLGVALVFTLGNSSNTFLLLRANSLGFTPAEAILLYLVYNVTYAVLSYPAGRVSDLLGRRVVLVSGYAVYGAVYLAVAALGGSARPWALWPLLALYGVYSGLTDGVERALVADLAPSSLRATALGLHSTIVGLGLFPASFLAGQMWTHVGPSAAFYFGGAIGIAAAVGLLVVLEPRA